MLLMVYKLKLFDLISLIVWGSQIYYIAFLQLSSGITLGMRSANKRRHYIVI